MAAAHPARTSHRWYYTITRRGLGGAVALGLSLLACYGTLAALAVLGALGIAVALNEAVWAGTIVAFAVLATVIVGLGLRTHRMPAPTLLAVAGTGLLGYVMFIRFDRGLEIVSFALLAASVFWDWRQRRRTH